MNYTLSIVHLGDRVVAATPSCRNSLAASAQPRLPEVQEIQRRLTAPASTPAATDGRVRQMTP